MIDGMASARLKVALLALVMECGHARRTSVLGCCAMDGMKADESTRCSRSIVDECSHQERAMCPSGLPGKALSVRLWMTDVTVGGKRRSGALTRLRVEGRL